MEKENQKFKVLDESNRFLYALCPKHRDTKPSLCINRVPNNGKPKGYFYCFGCGYFGKITPEEVDSLCVEHNVPVGQAIPENDTDWDALHFKYFCNEFSDSKSSKLAERWNVSLSIMAELCVGWDGHAHTIPMYNLDKVVGIQRQFTNGYKCMVSGSNLGLIVPMTMATGPVLFMPEGASDLACLLDMGLHGIGRPNALVGKELVYEWLKRYNPVYDRIIIVADNDENGIKGAKELQDYIDSEHSKSAVFVPNGFKDLRKLIEKLGKEYAKPILETYK